MDYCTSIKEYIKIVKDLLLEINEKQKEIDSSFKNKDIWLYYKLSMENANKRYKAGEYLCKINAQFKIVEKLMAEGKLSLSDYSDYGTIKKEIQELNKEINNRRKQNE